MRGLLPPKAPRAPWVKLQAGSMTRKVFAFRKDSSVSDRIPSRGGSLRIVKDLFTDR